MAKLGSFASYNENVSNESAPESPEAEIEEPTLTYRRVMMAEGGFSLTNFLAASVSRHNYGLAMDMTLVRASNMEELEMQTKMHDLSWHSMRSKNNANAELLRSFMEPAGFGMIRSEWWHFQDNDSKQKLNPPYMQNGVSCQGWVYDDNGMRYREKNGKYLASGTMEIAGEKYVFDDKGYASAAQ